MPFWCQFHMERRPIGLRLLDTTARSRIRAKKNARRQNPRSLTKVLNVENAISTYEKEKYKFTEVWKKQRAKLSRSTGRKRSIREFVGTIKARASQTLTSLHDFKQFIAKVKQNINVILETRYLGGTLDDKLRRSTKPEGGIYWASEMMEESLIRFFYSASQISY